MFRGGLSGPLQIPTPTQAPNVDFRAAAAPTVRDIVREPAPKGPPTLMEKLNALPVSAERNSYIGKLAILVEEIDAFLARSKSQDIATLERRHDEQTQVCRQMEDAFRSTRNELAELRQAMAHHAGTLNLVRENQRASEIPPYHSAYPTPQERDDWALRRHAAQIVRNQAERDHQEMQQQELQLVHAYEEAAQELQQADATLKSIDRELRETQ